MRLSPCPIYIKCSKAERKVEITILVTYKPIPLTLSKSAILIHDFDIKIGQMKGTTTQSVLIGLDKERY